MMKLLLLVSFLSLWRRGHETGAAVIKLVVKEGNDTILPCSLDNTNIKQDVFDWKKDKDQEVFLYSKGTLPDEEDPHRKQFKGRVSHFPGQLEVGNASIVIRDTKVTDSGHYTCIFPNPRPPTTRSNVELIVGASPKPFITTLGETADGVQLRCEVLGVFPKPEVQWQNRAGDIVPAEQPQVSGADTTKSYNIILQATVTKTDYYRCVSTQKEINHQIYTETYVPVPVPDKLTGPLVGVSVAFALLLVGVFGYCVCVKRKKASNSGTERGAEHTNGSNGEERRLNDGMKSC